MNDPLDDAEDLQERMAEKIETRHARGEYEEICPHCGHISILKDDGKPVCSRCGVIETTVTTEDWMATEAMIGDALSEWGMKQDILQSLGTCPQCGDSVTTLNRDVCQNCGFPIVQFAIDTLSEEYRQADADMRDLSEFSRGR